MKRKLTEAQAWREIARRIAEGTWRERGLCREVDHLYDLDDVSCDTWGVMHSRIRSHLNEMPVWGLYFDEIGEPDARVLAALFFALETRDER